MEWQPRLDEMGVVLSAFDGAKSMTERRKLTAGLLTFVAGWKKDLDAMEVREGFWGEFEGAGGMNALNELFDIGQQVLSYQLTGRQGVKRAEPYVSALIKAHREATVKSKHED